MLVDVRVDEIQNGLLFFGKHGDVLYPNTCMAVKCPVSEDKDESGIALVLVLILMALLSLLAAGLLTAVSTETRIADAYTSEAQLLYLAEAGIEHGRELVRQGFEPSIQNRAFSDTAGREVGRYSVTLLHSDPLMLRSVATVKNARKTIDVRLRKTGFPWVPDAITLDEGPLAEGLDPRLLSPGGLEQIVQGILRNATDVFVPGWGEVTGLGIIGSAEDYRTVAVEGDCELVNVTGYGLLLVRGDLTVSGTLFWNGLILVIGQGVMRASEGATGGISGAVFLARTRQADRSAENLLGTVLETRGPVTFALDAGALSIQRNDSEFERANKPFPYVATTYREF